MKKQREGQKMNKNDLNVYLINDGDASSGMLNETWLIHKNEQQDFEEQCEKIKEHLKSSGHFFISAEQIAEILVKEKGYYLLTDFLKETYDN